MAEKETFINLIEANQGIINKTVFLYADDPEDRRDLKQEIISQAWGSFGSFRGDAKFSTWLYRVATNVAISTLKKAKRAGRKEVVTEGASVSQFTHEHELLQIILSALNPIEKSIVLLMVEGFSQPEIAEMTGISENNTRTKIHRIRKKLEKHGVKEFIRK